MGLDDADGLESGMRLEGVGGMVEDEDGLVGWDGMFLGGLRTAAEVVVEKLVELIKFLLCSSIVP